MTSLRRSLAVNFLSTNGATAIQFLVTIVLARLLDPSEIGIYSITAVMVSIAHVFRDFGVASYLQQEKELTRDRVGAAFGVLLTTSWFIAAMVFLLSWPAATFYGRSEIQEVMQVMAIGFVFIPFGAITHSLLTREYRATEQAYVRVASTVAYALSVIALAYNGFSYMSMAWANLVNIIVTALAYIPFRPVDTPWLPRFKGWRPVLNFGAGATLGNSLGAINSAIPDVVLGKISGPHDVGIMSRAWSTTNILNQVIGPTISYAILPFLAKAHHSGQNLSLHLERGCTYMTGIMWPALLAMAVFSEPVILFLYGEKWIDTTSIMQWLALMFVLATPFGFTPPAYLAIGRPYLSTAPTIASLTTRAISIYLIYDGTLLSFGISLVVAAVLMYPFQAWMQWHYLGFRVGRFLACQAPSFYVASVCTVVAIITRWQTTQLPPGLILLSAAIIIPLAWFICIWHLHHPLREEFEIILARYTASREARGK